MSIQVKSGDVLQADVNMYAEQNNYSIAFSYGIGCGRGGADWAIVSKIIKDIFYEMDVEIWKL